MTPASFIPTLLASLGLGFASFYGKKDLLILAFSVWLMVFTLTIVIPN